MSKTSQNYQVIEAFFKLSRLMKENMSYSCNITKLTLLQIQTLVFLHQNPNVQMRDIAGQFKIEMPTATSLINKLCKLELAERKEDSQDRRLVRISLTTQGKSLLTKAMKERSNKLNTTLSYLAESDKNDLLRLISIIIDKMELQIKNEK